MSWPPAHRHDGSPEARWSLGDTRATLTLYQGGGAFPLHAHDHLQVSFVLAGSMRERLGGRLHEVETGWRGRKPAGERHEDLWGPGGVLLFTLRFAGEAEPVVSQDPGWSRCDPHIVSPLVRAFRKAPAAALQREVLDDLLALGGHVAGGAGRPPAWLRRVRESVLDAPGCAAIGAIAKEAGVHRAQLSRMFRHHYGVPPSIFRRRALVVRAVAALVHGKSTIAETALDTGFYDQGHLSRVLRRETGLTPGEVIGLLRDIRPRNRAAGKIY